MLYCYCVQIYSPLLFQSLSQTHYQCLKVPLRVQISPMTSDWPFAHNLIKPSLNQIRTNIEKLRKNAQSNFSSLPDKQSNLLVQFIRSNILISISGGYEIKSIMMKFNHNLSHSPLGKRIGFLFLHRHQLSLQKLELIVQIHQLFNNYTKN